MRRNAPNWFPNLGSWMSAIFLLLLTGFLTVAIRHTYSLASSFSSQPRLLIPFAILALVLPIISIASTHHLSALLETPVKTVLRLTVGGKEGQGLCRIGITILFVNLFTVFVTNPLNQSMSR